MKTHKLIKTGEILKHMWKECQEKNHYEINLMALLIYLVLKKQKLIWLPNLDIHLSAVTIIWDCTFKETAITDM